MIFFSFYNSHSKFYPCHPVNGYSFYPPIKNQECGDCYLVASLSCIESRIRIATNGKLKPTLSNKQQKDCNWYVEGCEGGLPINVAKYGWEFQLTSEEWYPSGSSGNTWNWDLINSQDCQKYYTLVCKKKWHLLQKKCHPLQKNDTRCKKKDTPRIKKN